MKRLILLSFFTLLFAINVDAQRNCGAMDHLEHLQELDPKMDLRIEKIEKATRAFLEKDESQRMDGVITIPVVFHVVYNTTAENISDARILDQLDALNADFRRTNPDADGTWPQAADSEFEFCLATTDPNGAATTGINRVQTSVTAFGTNDNVKFSSSGGVDAWNTSEYLNIWVCNIGGGILGYAQFPGGPAATDGVVNLYSATGGPNVQGTAVPYNLGRTLTHEVGHYLNLRHIWGDGGCGVDDFVTDTPTSDASNFGCATGHISCGSVDMVENYMDYSDDACMNLFTEGQKTRMRALFDAGGFRESLLTSMACGEPADPTCDDGIQNGDETGVDCGGSCPNACPPDPTCDDGMMNGDEEGVDCGGSECDPCPCLGVEVTVSITFDNYPEETSWEISDGSGVVASGGTYGSEPDGSTLDIPVCLEEGCYTFTILDAFGDGICCGFGNGSYIVSVGGQTVVSGNGEFDSSESTGFCTTPSDPTCDDGIQNGDEEGVDCGGSECPVCPTCDDGMMNGDEEGVDCGGSECPACPTCDDGMMNGDEEGVDCGGTECIPCPTCDDGIQNGDEFGVDCGGSECEPCTDCQDIIVDSNDFESGFGIWNDGGSDCIRSSAAAYANSGTRSIRLRDNSSSSVVTTDNLALAGFESLTVDFTYITRSMENGEDFWIDGSLDGGATWQPLFNWVRGVDFSNSSREFVSIGINSDAFNNTTKLRFRCDASANNDWVYLDDIVIGGCGFEDAGATRLFGNDLVAEVKADVINDVNVYPNPTTDILNIKYAVTTDTRVQLNVLDMSGRRLMTSAESAVKGENTTSMQVSELNAGIYYIQINTGEQQIVKKFVVIE